MTRWGIPFLIVLVLFCLLPWTVNAESFGPDEWHQYRLEGDKNAVFDHDDAEPLDYHEFKTANEVRATPVIVGDRLFIGNHDTGELFAFDVTTGEKLWENEAPNWIHSEMIYHDGMVYVGFGDRFEKGNGMKGKGDSGLLALDADTGKVRWKFATEGEVMPTPVYHDDAVYITTGGHRLYKLDSESGDVEHEEKLGSRVSMSSPAMTDDKLYVGGSGPFTFKFSAYDMQEDELDWQTKFSDVFAGLDDVPPAVSDGIVVTTALEGNPNDPEHMLYAMDTETGDIRWKKSLGAGDFVQNNKSGAPMIYEGNIYVGSPITETFYAYDLKTGEQLWKFDDEVMKSPPVAQDGTVYFPDTEGTVYAMDAETGDVLGKKELVGTIAPAGPVIMNDTFFVGSQDTNVYAIPLEDIKNGKDDATDAKEDAEERKAAIWMMVGGLAIVAIVVLIFSWRHRKQKKKI